MYSYLIRTEGLEQHGNAKQGAGSWPQIHSNPLRCIQQHRGSPSHAGSLGIDPGGYSIECGWLAAAVPGPRPFVRGIRGSHGRQSLRHLYDLPRSREVLARKGPARRHHQCSLRRRCARRCQYGSLRCQQRWCVATDESIEQRVGRPRHSSELCLPRVCECCPIESGCMLIRKKRNCYRYQQGRSDGARVSGALRLSHQAYSDGQVGGGRRFQGRGCLHGQ